MAYSVMYLHRLVPLDSRYEHTLLWNSQNQQLNYLNSSGIFYKGYTDFTFLRKDMSVKVPEPLEELENNAVNYVSMQNPNGTWRFYFINNKEYVSPDVTRLVLELDVLQTYQFFWDIPACFVEREHVADDSIGANLVDEGLELGEYVNNGIVNTTVLDELAIVCMSSVTMANPMGEPVTGGLINGVYHGLKMYCRTADVLGATVVNAALSSLSTQGKADGVVSIFMYPKNLINADWKSESESVMLEVKGMQMVSVMAERPPVLDLYVPRNRKLLTHPYSYLYAHNNAGESAIYHYEHFWNGPDFFLAGSCSQDGVVRMVPKNHRQYQVDTEAGLSLTGYPSCSWSQDAYKIWLAQNQASQALAIQGGEWTQKMAVAGGVMSVLGAAIQKDVLGGVGGVISAVDTYHSGHMQIESVMAARSDRAVQPPQAKGTQSPSTNIGMGYQHFTLSQMSIRYDQAERLDQYFDMYGYKVNMVKKPRISGRAVWNYVKTIGCVVNGGFDANDRRLIGAIFDKGVTFWHAPETIFRYDMAASNVVR